MPITINNKPANGTAVNHKPVAIHLEPANTLNVIPKRIAARDRQACLACGKPIPKGTMIAQITSPLTNKSTWIHASCVEQTAANPTGVDANTIAKLDNLAEKVDQIAAKAWSNKKEIIELGKQVAELEAKQPVRIELVINNGSEVTTKQLPADELYINEFPTLLKLASIGENIYMSGPTQCGKTHVCSQIARALDRPFYFISCFDEMTAGDLFGRLDIVDGMKMEWIDGPFVKAYEEGGVFLLDEMDMGNEKVLGALNAALAGDTLSLPKRKTGLIAKRHPNFVCIAAANTWGGGATREYCGRNQIDGATLERFATAMIAVDYNDELEQKLAASEIYNWLKGVRAKVRQNKIRKHVTTRSMIRFTKQLASGFTMDEIKTRFFASWSADEVAKVN